jgi:hypothetical protein
VSSEYTGWYTSPLVTRARFPCSLPRDGDVDRREALLVELVFLQVAFNFHYVLRNLFI